MSHRYFLNIFYNSHSQHHILCVLCTHPYFSSRYLRYNNERVMAYYYHFRMGLFSCGNVCLHSMCPIPARMHNVLCFPKERCSFTWLRPHHSFYYPVYFTPDKRRCVQRMAYFSLYQTGGCGKSLGKLKTVSGPLTSLAYCNTNKSTNINILTVLNT